MNKTYLPVVQHGAGYFLHLIYATEHTEVAASKTTLCGLTAQQGWLRLSHFDDRPKCSNCFGLRAIQAGDLMPCAIRTVWYGL